MKKIYILLIATSFFVPSVSHAVTKNTSDWCYTFTEPIFNGKYEMYSDAHSSAVSYGMKKEEKMYFDVLTNTKNDISALHIVLEKEGFKISDTEKNQKTFKESTVGAVLSLQKKYKNDTLSVNGFSKGIVSRDGVLWLNKVYGCKKESSLTKQFTVVSPNGGEQYNTVGSFTVRWTPVTEKLAKKIVVYLVDTNTGKKSVLKEVTPSITQIVYTLPKNGIEGSVTGIGTFLDARYKIEVQVLDGKGKAISVDMSNRAFSISKKTDGLQLIKPTKGTKIEIGEMIRVEWTYASTSNANQPIFIELLNKSGKVVQNISASSTKISDTSIQTKLNSEIVPGSYKIKAYTALKNRPQIVSESDMFDIVAKPSLVTVTAPAANVKVRIGNTLTARWSVKSLPMNLHGYDVYIVDTVTNKKQRIASVSKINSSYIWTPPINGIVGSGDGAIWGIGDTDTKKYKIEVHMVDVSGVSIGFDQSDSAFAIVR